MKLSASAVFLGISILASDHAIERIVKKEILSCAPHTSVLEAARQMAQLRCSSIIVVEDGLPVGIWTERDALAVDFGNPDGFARPIAEVMSHPIKTIHCKTSIGDAGLRFQMEGVRHFVVVDDAGQAMGIISQSDVILRHGVEHFLVLRNVRSGVSRPMVAIPGEYSLQQAVAQLNAAHADAAVVLGIDGGEPGIITERDLIRIIAGNEPVPACVDAIASRPLVSITEDDSMLSARNLLEERHIRHVAVRDNAGELKGLLSFSDILSSLQYEYVQRLDEALRERDEALLRSRKDLHLARQVIEASLDGIMICNAHGMVEFVNPAFTLLTGYSFEEVHGKNPNILKSGRHDAAFYTRMWEALEARGVWQGEVWNRRKNGDHFPEWLTINVIRDDEGHISQYAAVFTDITERKKTEERIKNLAYFDVLTGLPNRRLFTDRLQVAIANAHRHGSSLAIMFLDLDLFKRINDTLGHGIGDKVLVETASRLELCIREGDTVARLGGDEFVVLLPELDHVEDAAKLSERIISLVRQPFVIDEHELYVTTSVGIAVYPDDGLTAESLIKNADTAMYRAKDLGRNSYQLYTPSMNARSFERLAMESSLRHALSRDEFMLVYQGKVDMVTGRMSGVEALVRWRHPEMGMVLPNEFIPLAENMGLIGDIGAWVLKAACRQCKSWHDLGLPPVRIAVNVSALQFREGDVPAIVRQALDESGLSPHFLELELTESVLMQRVEEVAQVLRELRQMGVHISIDDFGTGYSSLAYLRRFPVDKLKIDIAFVRDVTTNPDAAAIALAIVRMAHSLKLEVIAEGVETASQLAYLRLHGCDQM
ncbi:MAG: EAL domain-containing protein, partial [Rhodospirillaceae bacterium]|nr:EAL domain-containing protein [Rhodospirillales bacterium]